MRQVQHLHQHPELVEGFDCLLTVHELREGTHLQSQPSLLQGVCAAQQPGVIVEEADAWVQLSALTPKNIASLESMMDAFLVAHDCG